MSTQHPDNVNVPFFAAGPVMAGEDEIREAFYAYSHLGCDEQMWDFEGKEVDNFVVQKLLSGYEGFFRDEPLGRRIHLTPRVPNPRLERVQAKGLLEVLHSLPRHADAARLFYGEERTPITELIFPMTTTADELDRIRNYYLRYVAGLEDEPSLPGNSSFRDLFGEFQPRDIQVIPLIEDLPYLLGADEIVAGYLRGKDLAQQRVFIARSDPALNYGLVAAVLASLVALERIERVQESVGTELLPIIGCGGAPFRGGLRPETVERVVRTYPSVQTFTLQSSFKYDHPPADVRAAIATLRGAGRSVALEVSGDERLQGILRRAAARYREEVGVVIPLVNAIAPLVPKRRMRKLHVGLFGYGRDTGDRALPRAITFCAALYSMGLPPEVLGAAALSDGDWDYLCARVPTLRDDLGDALRYLDSEAAAGLPVVIRESVDAARRNFDSGGSTDVAHADIARAIRRQVMDGQTPETGDLVLRAATLRHFLG